MSTDVISDYIAYDPLTGEFTWKRSPAHGMPSGTSAGCVCSVSGRKKYRRVMFRRTLYYLHRVAFLIVTGAWPEHEVDHIDGDGLNNRWENLRAATVAENMRNRGAPRNNTTGYKGVTFNKRAQRFRATIMVRRKSNYLGDFDTAEEAHAAYCEAARIHHGEFVRVA